MPIYVFDMCCTMRARIRVEAETEDEAEDIAMEKANAFDMDYDDDSMEIVRLTEFER